jgi:hypothetical protein
MLNISFARGAEHQQRASLPSRHDRLDGDGSSPCTSLPGRGSQDFDGAQVQVNHGRAQHAECAFQRDCSAAGSKMTGGYGLGKEQPMNTRFLILKTALAALVSLGTAPSIAADDPFQRIRRLEGTWLVVNERGEVEEQISSVFRVTSNGHSVVETMFPGTPNEMINVYYRDVDKVLVTHFCAGGNQPILQLVPSARADTVVLQFVDITNMATIDDEHMHEGQYQWLGEDRLRTEWRSFKRGRQSGVNRFEMVRKP